MALPLAATFLIAYTLGSIPFGLLLSYAMGCGDLRKVGSGNIGATNALRTGNKILAFATLFLDAAKGVAAVVLCQHLFGEHYALLAAFIAVAGHIYPVWLGFKGGKGVATSLGVFFALSWALGLAVCLLWLIVFIISRISSLASLISLGYSSVVAYMVADFWVALVCLAVASLVMVAHRGNIARLLAGNEPSMLRKTP